MRAVSADELGAFWFVLIGCVLAMWACRVIPLFLLKGRELPPRLAQALGFIPPRRSRRLWPTTF